MNRFESRRFRRNLIGSVAAIAAATALPNVLTAQSSTPVASPNASPVASPAASGEWIFTDDRGVTVTLPQLPTRIVADLSAAESLTTTESIVPIVAISATGAADENMQRFAELAGLLGADLESPELVAAKDTYDASVAAFSAIAAEKADLSILFGYVGTDPEWYAAAVPAWADLAWYRSLGLNMIDVNAEPGAHWETLSFEQVLLYPSDVIFLSTRAGTVTTEELKADPTFGLHPAIVGDQVGSWNQNFIMSYQGLTAALDNMTTTLTTAKKII